MRVIAETEKSDIATVYIAEFGEGKYLEFVESTQPPIPREKKWVLIVSTLFGCPIGCKFCDSGWQYFGKLSKQEIFQQIDYIVSRRFPTREINTDKFKIQFSRMGEPTLNENVLDVLEEFDQHFKAKNFIPSLSTVAPIGRDNFFARLLEIKKKKYDDTFQLQFSIHSTNYAQRDKIIPVKKMNFQEIAQYGEKFYSGNNRKITLNFALFKDAEVDVNIIREYFNPEFFLIKLTPVNPTAASKNNNIVSEVFSNSNVHKLVKQLEASGFDVILSIGEMEENKIGSNCGQYITNFLKMHQKYDDAYTYPLIFTNESL
ncbi:MAG: radical SAM protein [Bacteroidota bacterium]